MALVPGHQVREPRIHLAAEVHRHHVLRQGGRRVKTLATELTLAHRGRDDEGDQRSLLLSGLHRSLLRGTQGGREALLPEELL